AKNQRNLMKNFISLDFEGIKNANQIKEELAARKKAKEWRDNYYKSVEYEDYKESDNYIKKLIRRKPNANGKYITPEMIELKRESIEFKRLTKELENVINRR
ncbi:MAG: hypothetical protein KKD05_10770, partial [Candidatus Omnitrophica bacterium]|nr:hypothetical protein [Candidatus Omnitrophota bacterium]